MKIVCMRACNLIPQYVSRCRDIIDTQIATMACETLHYIHIDPHEFLQEKPVMVCGDEI